MNGYWFARAAVVSVSMIFNPADANPRQPGGVHRYFPSILPFDEAASKPGVWQDCLAGRLAGGLALRNVRRSNVAGEESRLNGFHILITSNFCESAIGLRISLTRRGHGTCCERVIPYTGAVQSKRYAGRIEDVEGDVTGIGDTRRSATGFANAS